MSDFSTLTAEIKRLTAVVERERKKAWKARQAADRHRRRARRFYQQAYMRALQRDVWMRRYDQERAQRIQLERRLTLVERDAA